MTVKDCISIVNIQKNQVEKNNSCKKMSLHDQ